MKLIVDLRKLSRKPSGIGMYIYNFINSLQEKDNIEIIGITDVIESDEIKNLNDGISKLYSYGKVVDKGYAVFKYFNYIKSILLKENADFFWEPNYIFTKKLKKLEIKTKLIITIFDITPIINKEFYSLLYRLYFKFFLGLSIANSDIIFFDSNDVKVKLNMHYKIMKTNFITYVIVNNLAEKSVIQDEDYFLFISNIERRKGVDILLKAYELYRKSNGSKGLIFVGNSRDALLSNDIQELANKYSNVKYFGYIDELKKIELISKCSALVYPSYAEGFGIPPIEALLLTKPVIVSDLDVFKEVLGDSANYFCLSKDKDKSIKNLSNVLIKYSKPKEELINQVCNKYSSENLTNALIDFLENYNLK